MDRPTAVVLFLLSFLSRPSSGAELLHNEIPESVEPGWNAEQLHRFLSPIAAEVRELKSRVSNMEEIVQQLQHENRGRRNSFSLAFLDQLLTLVFSSSHFGPVFIH